MALGVESERIAKIVLILLEQQSTEGANVNQKTHR